MVPVSGRPRPSADEIFNFFAEQMWRPSVMSWVGWPAAIACLACGLFTVFTHVYPFGILLLLAFVGLTAYLVHATMQQRRRWADYIEVSKSQIARDSEQPESTLCLVQSFPMGLQDRLLIARRSDIHFKGYFMPAAKARRLAGAPGIGYVESAKVISGTLPLKAIRKFLFRHLIRFRYAFLTFLGLGGGIASLPRLLTTNEHNVIELIGVIGFFVLGVLCCALLFLHRFPVVIIRTDEYDLQLMADRPDPETVLQFLHRIGYRKIQKQGVAARPKK